MITFYQANPSSEEALAKLMIVSEHSIGFEFLWICRVHNDSNNEGYLGGADATRALACKALLGLTRNEDILQLLKKMLSHGQVQVDIIF